MLTRRYFSSPEYFSASSLPPSAIFHSKSNYCYRRPLVSLQDLCSSPASLYDTSLAFAAFFQS
ncbi:hypothetical protein HOY82DRAFT_576186 [Tuber indicum]|nr:hypothetical protein HOY82DRAFT_576186 [Tuber indicum]